MLREKLLSLSHQLFIAQLLGLEQLLRQLDTHQHPGKLRHAKSEQSGWLPKTMSALRKRGWSAAACMGVHLIKCLSVRTGDSPCHAFSSLFDPAILCHWLPTKEHARGCSDGWSCLFQLCLSAQQGRHTCWNPFWQLQEEQHSRPCLWQAREYACLHRQEGDCSPVGAGS